MLANVMAIGVVVENISPNGLTLSLKQTEPIWWIACVYLTATHAISIALPLCFDPGSLMRRPQSNRWLLIVTHSNQFRSFCQLPVYYWQGITPEDEKRTHVFIPTGEADVPNLENRHVLQSMFCAMPHFVR